jgi:sigma-E factor negative regulatory protein RseC
MMIESGRVVAVERDGLWVETIRKSTCGTCAVQKGCGHGIINRMTDGSRNYLRVLPGDHSLSECAVDDQVRFAVPEEVILRGSLVVYVLPLLCMLSGALLAVRAVPGNQDLLAAIGAAVGFVAGIGLVRWHAWRHRDDAAMQPTLVAIQRPVGQPVSLA